MHIFLIGLKKGWFLKQRLDHPREYASPDCPICETEKQKNEKLHGQIKRKKINKKTEQIVTKEKINELLTDPQFTIQMMNKYPLITKVKYRRFIDIYSDWIFTIDHTIEDHKRGFEGRLMGEHEILMKKEQSD